MNGGLESRSIWIPWDVVTFLGYSNMMMNIYSRNGNMFYKYWNTNIFVMLTENVY